MSNNEIINEELAQLIAQHMADLAEEAAEELIWRKHQEICRVARRRSWPDEEPSYNDVLF